MGLFFILGTLAKVGVHPKEVSKVIQVKLEA